MNTTTETEEIKIYKKSDIVTNIIEDDVLKALLKSYKNDLTSGFGFKFKQEYENNGLANITYGVTIKDKLIALIIPIFSTEKTTTWNFSYLKTIKQCLPKEFQDLDDGELVNLIKCPLYYFDKYTGTLQYMSLVSLSDWLVNGSKGQNKHSVYYWNDKLPNKDNLTKKDIISEMFVLSLPLYTKKQTKDICKDYATQYYKRFANPGERTATTRIKNIADGLYAQIQVYLYLLKEGYNVSIVSPFIAYVKHTR